MAGANPGTSGMDHVRGAPHQPRIQRKFERWRQTLKNRVLLGNHDLPGHPERQIDTFVDRQDHRRYDQIRANLTPADLSNGRGTPPLKVREAFWKQMIRKRRLQHQTAAA